jgi:SAM-dependent methyltransferase
LITLPQPPEHRLPEYYESEDYVSHTDSKRNLIERLYHGVKEYSLKRKLRLIGRVNQGEKLLLDIGSGTGDFLKTCQDAEWSVTGIEPNAKARALAERKVGRDICYESLQHLLDSNDDKYDVITLWHVLEHVTDLYAYIEKIKTRLQKKGSLVIAVPNFKSSDALHYASFWAGYDVPRHLWHFSRASIQKIFADFDMEVAEEIPLYFDSFYVSLLSEKYKSGSPRYLPALYQGLKSNWLARSTGEYSSLIYLLK